MKQSVKAKASTAAPLFGTGISTAFTRGHSANCPALSQEYNTSGAVTKQPRALCGLFSSPGVNSTQLTGSKAQLINWVNMFIQMTPWAYVSRLRAEYALPMEECVLGGILTVTALVDTLQWILIFFSVNSFPTHACGLVMMVKKHPTGISGASSSTLGLIHMSWVLQAGSSVRLSTLLLSSSVPRAQAQVAEQVTGSQVSGLA